MKRFLLFTLVSFTFAGLVVAKGTADKIIITTPTGRTVEVTDSTLTEPISMAALETFPKNIPEPNVTGKGYVLIRQYRYGNGYRTFDNARYFPAGEHGYVFYIGIENGWSEYDGKWFEATRAGVEAMNRIINNIPPLSLKNVRCVLA